MDYATQEASFALPNGFADVTLNRLVYKRPTGDLQVVVARSAAQGQSLEEAVTARLRDQQRGIPYFEIGDRSARQVANRPAIDTRVTYVERERKRYQRSASFVVDKKVLVMAVLGPAEGREEIDAIFETALASLAFRDQGD
jgi:hypothetical protein